MKQLLYAFALFYCLQWNAVVQSKLATPLSGGLTRHEVLKEYNFIAYPDMDYQSLFSKYSTLGRLCDKSHNICGAGMVCRTGAYNTDHTRCFFNPCSPQNNKRPTPNCINLDQVIWEMAVVNNDGLKNSDYLSQTNLYSSPWHLPNTHQDNIYNIYLATALPENPVFSYDSNNDDERTIKYCFNSTDGQCGQYCTKYPESNSICIWNQCQMGDCNKNKNLCKGICSCTPKKDKNNIYHVCQPYAKGGQGQGLKLDKNFCLSNGQLQCEAPLGTGDQCNHDSDCYQYRGCNVCNTDSKICEKGKSTCSVFDDTWKNNIREISGENVSFTKEHFINNYLLFKDSDNPNSDTANYTVFYNSQASPLLKIIQPVPKQNIISILARLKQIEFIKKAWNQWYALCKTPQRIRSDIVLASDDIWTDEERDTALINYQTWTGGNLQINCLTTNPVPEIGSVFLQQSKNLNIPGLLDQTRPEFFNNKDNNRLSSRGWYDAESIFQYYLSRCDMENSALSNLLHCLESKTGEFDKSYTLNYCKYCTSNLFPMSCELNTESRKDHFIYNNYKIKQQIFGYKKMDLCINPTALTHIPSNQSINSDSVINVTPQVLPLDTSNETVIKDCTNEDTMCIPCDENVQDHICSSKNCHPGYSLSYMNDKWTCAPISPPSSNRKLIFKYLLNWGG